VAFRTESSEQRDTVKRIYNAAKNSWRGIVDGVTTEAAVREETVLLVLAIPLGFFIAPSMAWYLAMIGSFLVLLAIEFLNTAIEKLSDHVTPEHHHDIGRIKDFGSSAVFCGLALVGLVWIAALAVRFAWL
jgi:diacylglycerol kinase (ATP)